MPNELTNPNNVVTEERLAEFYQQILPYLGGASHLCIGGGYAPIGTILTFMGTIAPGGFLACDGSVYNIADYPALANFIDAQFGSIDFFGGDGLVTFAVPDLRGEFLRGTGTNGHTGEGNGSNVGEHQSGTIVPNIFFDDAVKNFAVPNVKSSGNTTPKNVDSGTSSGGTGKGRYVYANGEWQGAGTNVRAYTIRPTNTSVLYCIKAELDNTYSTTEKIVGTWIDGKPLYQKSVKIDNPSSRGDYVTAFAIQNLGVLVKAEGIAVRASSMCTYAFSGGIRPEVPGNYQFSVSIRYYNNNIEYLIGSYNDVSTLYVTIQYTKTSS